MFWTGLRAMGDVYPVPCFLGVVLVTRGAGLYTDQILLSAFNTDLWYRYIFL